MKRYILVALILVLVLIPKGSEFYTVASTFHSGEYCFYISSAVDESDFLRVEKNGDGYLAYCPLSNAPNLKDSYRDDIEGESFWVTGGMGTVREILSMLGGVVVSEGTVDGIYTVYVYTGRLNCPSVVLFGDKVNVQIALNDDKVTVGYPIILGSY